MLRAAGLGGLGVHGTYQWLHFWRGFNWDLHNTYLRVWCEDGVVVGSFVVIGSVLLGKSIIKDIIHAHELQELTVPLILLTGLLAGLWEPGAVFGSVNWWSLWWFALGVYIANKRFNNAAFHRRE